MHKTSAANQSIFALTMETQSLEGVSLKLYPPKLGLPSIDPDSLAVLAYTKFTRAYIHTEFTFSRFEFIRNGGDHLPSLTLQDGNSRVSVENIINQLRDMGFNADFELSRKQEADAVAFLSMMENQLKPAVLHTLWLTEENFDHVTKEALAADLAFPSSMIAPRRLRDLATKHMLGTSSGSLEYVTKEALEHTIYKDALNCMKALSDKLSTRPFLLGTSPTTVDAVMFGYLAPLLKLPLPKNKLRSHLESLTNLVNTTNHILTRYFLPDAKDLQDQRLHAEARRQAEAETEFPHKLRDSIIAIVFGVTVFVSYTVLRGHIPSLIEDAEEGDE